MSRHTNEVLQMRKSAYEQTQGLPLYKCVPHSFILHLPCSDATGTSCAVESKARLSLRRTSPVTPAKLDFFAQQFLGDGGRGAAALSQTRLRQHRRCEEKKKKIQHSHTTSVSHLLFRYDQSSVVHSNPVEKHLLRTCRGGSPVRACVHVSVSVCVCG